MLPNPADQRPASGSTALRRGLLGLLFALGLGSACSESGDPSDGLAPAGLGELQLSVTGLPAGATAAISISSGQGYQKSVSGSGTLTGLPAGSYAVGAVEIVIAGDRYVPAAASQTVSVQPGAPATLQVVYVLTTARLELSLGGFPAGTGPTLLLTGPGGFSQAVATSGILTGLAPGSYTLETPGLIAGGDQYKSLPESREIPLVKADTIPVFVAVACSPRRTPWSDSQPGRTRSRRQRSAAPGIPTRRCPQTSRSKSRRSCSPRRRW